MRLTICSECGQQVKSNRTSIVDHKRICHKCKNEKVKKQEALFLSKVVASTQQKGGLTVDKMPVSSLQKKS